MKTGRWKDLKNETMSPERQARSKDRVDRLELEMNLAELRKGVAGLNQTELAELLGVSQSAISQIERREDALLSNLAEYVKALGGTLELVAHFEDGKDVRIIQFDEVKEQLKEATA